MARPGRGCSVGRSFIHDFMPTSVSYTLGIMVTRYCSEFIEYTHRFKVRHWHYPPAQWRCIFFSTLDRYLLLPSRYFSGIFILLVHSYHIRGIPGCHSKVKVWWLDIPPISLLHSIRCGSQFFTLTPERVLRPILDEFGILPHTMQVCIRIIIVTTEPLFLV